MDIRRLHVKRWVSGLLIPLLSTVANAQEPSEQDLLLMAAAQKAVATYRDSGVAGTRSRYNRRSPESTLGTQEGQHHQSLLKC